MVNGDGAHERTEEAESKQDGSGEVDGGEESNEQEVIVIQDTGFTVKIQAPGTEPFDLQVRISSSQAAVHEASCSDRQWNCSKKPHLRLKYVHVLY